MAHIMATHAVRGEAGPERRVPPVMQREPGLPGFHSVIFDGPRQDRVPPFFGPPGGQNTQAGNRRTSSVPRLRPRDANNPQPPNMPLDDLHA